MGDSAVLRPAPSGSGILAKTPLLHLLVYVNDRRLTKPQVRRPGSDHWEDIGWEQAVDEIGRAAKKTRDETDSPARSAVVRPPSQRTSPKAAERMGIPSFTAFCR